MLQFETVHRRKDGSEYPVEVHLQLFADESPAVFVAIILDITIRKVPESQVRMLNEDLERRVEARTREFEDANDSLQETLLI